MKRTNLVLDAQKLETATRLMGAKTYSEAVNRALDESIRLIKVRNLTTLFGSGAWEGDLAETREDRPVKRKKSRR